jgi:hypothetical protein
MEERFLALTAKLDCCLRLITVRKEGIVINGDGISGEWLLYGLRFRTIRQSMLTGGCA